MVYEFIGRLTTAVRFYAVRAEIIMWKVEGRRRRTMVRIINVYTNERNLTIDERVPDVCRSHFNCRPTECIPFSHIFVLDMAGPTLLPASV